MSKQTPRIDYSKQIAELQSKFDEVWKNKGSVEEIRDAGAAIAAMRVAEEIDNEFLQMVLANPDPEAKVWKNLAAGNANGKSL